MDRIVAARDVSPVEMEQAGSGYLGEALYSRAPSRIDISIGGQTALLRDLCDTMKHGSLCALGGFTPYPVLSAPDHFPADFGAPAPVRSVERRGGQECVSTCRSRGCASH